MATPQGPVCEVRLLVVHRYQPGVQKLGSTPCEVEFFGRRGKPVKKMRLIPAERALGLPRFSGQVSRLHPNQCKGIGELLLVVDRTEVSDR